MKKAVTLILIALVALSGASAAFRPVRSSESDPIFSSPALIKSTEKDTDCTLSVVTRSDTDALSFMADPVKGLQKSAEWAANELRTKDLEFWQKNPEIVRIFSSLDQNFPQDLSHGEYSLHQIRKYFSSDFLSEEYEDTRRAHAVSSLAVQAPWLFPYESYELLGGNLELSMKVDGEHISNGFGWKWHTDLGWYGPESFLGEGTGALRLSAGAKIGYAFSLFSPDFSLGLSAEPGIVIDNLSPGSSFISSRMSGDALGMFTEPLRFGTYIKLNLGAAWNSGSGLTFTLDARNVPSFSSWFLWPLTNLAEGNLMPIRDKDIWFEAPDIALRALYDGPKWSLDVEISHILDQLLWQDSLEGYSFDFWQILDLGFSWSFDEETALHTRLGREEIELGVRWRAMDVTLSTKMDRGHVGLSFAWSW